MYTLGEGLWGVAGRGGVHIRGGALGCGRKRCCTHTQSNNWMYVLNFGYKYFVVIPTNTSFN